MDLADLQRLVDAFEASDWNEIHLAVDGVEVHLSATGGLPPAAGAAAPTAAGATAAASAPAVPAPGSAGAPPASAHPRPRSHLRQAPPPPSHLRPPPRRATALPRGSRARRSPPPARASGPGRRPTAGEPVLAPSPGIFWRSPAPGQPPFVEVGGRVEADTVVCIVELMKLMNRVSAGRAGVVTAIPVGNGLSVEKGEPIVYVQPDPAP